MNDAAKPTQSLETSMKYLAWSIKEMSENIKKIALLLEESHHENNKRKHQHEPYRDPFK